MTKWSSSLRGDGEARRWEVDDAMRDDSEFAIFLSARRRAEGENSPGRRRWRKACWSWDKKGRGKAEESEAGTRHPPCSLPLWSAVRASSLVQLLSASLPFLSITITPPAPPRHVFGCVLSTSWASDVSLMSVAADLQQEVVAAPIRLSHPVRERCRCSNTLLRCLLWHSCD